KNEEVSRYMSLNVTNIGSYDKNTVEFRLFPGTLNSTKIAGYVQLALGLCEKARVEKRAGAPWLAKYDPESRFYSPEKSWSDELERLFRALGWYPLFRALGWYPKGKLYGWILGTDALKPVKAELRRLARKLDDTGITPSIRNRI
ncbi:MAG: amidoligase family protein, partial [Candidatus Freyarchaeota archaeon]